MKGHRSTAGRQHEQTNGAHERERAPTSEGSFESMGDTMDTVALSQYLNTRGAQWDLEPEKKLMLAVLQDAIDCFRKNVFSNREKKNELFHEAEAWILDDDDSDLFSFENICEVFDIDPAYLRKGLMSYKQRARHRRAA